MDINKHGWMILQPEGLNLRMYNNIIQCFRVILGTIMFLKRTLQDYRKLDLHPQFSDNNIDTNNA